MEAKDTVMSKVTVCSKLHGDHKWLAVTPSIVDKEMGLLDEQAEISFKAGYKEALDKMSGKPINLADFATECIQKGRREVVEWVEEHSLFSNRQTNNWCEWQAQKKEWGIDGN